MTKYEIKQSKYIYMYIYWQLAEEEWKAEKGNEDFENMFFNPMPPHVLVDFVVLPPEHGRSVTDFWGWEGHEARLRCPGDVSGDIGGCNARRAVKPKFY